MSQLFRKNINNGAATEEDLKYTIKVIKPAYWLVLLGGFVILLAAGLWMSVRTNTITINLTGVYHPGTNNFGEVICFPQLAVGKQLDEGMKAQVSIPSYNTSKYGRMEGTITYTEPYIATDQEMLSLLESQSLASSFYQGGPATCIIIKLDEDAETVSGYKWNNPNGKDLTVKDGTLVSVSVITAVENSFSLVKLKP